MSAVRESLTTAYSELRLLGFDVFWMNPESKCEA